MEDEWDVYEQRETMSGTKAIVLVSTTSNRLARAIPWFYIQQLALLHHDNTRGPHLDPRLYEKAPHTNVVPNTKLLAFPLINIAVKP